MDSKFVLFLQRELKGLSVTTLLWCVSKLASHARLELMKNIVEFRACRQLAMWEPKNSSLWLAEAERWSRLAQDEIASHYEECNVIQTLDVASRSICGVNT